MFLFLSLGLFWSDLVLCLSVSVYVGLELCRWGGFPSSFILYQALLYQAHLSAIVISNLDALSRGIDCLLSSLKLLY